MGGLSGNARGALIMMVAMAAFTINDSIMKTILVEIPLFQALFLRGCGAVLGLLAIARWVGEVRIRLPRRDWMLILIRSLSEVVAAWLFLRALQHMPLPNVTAILQSLPLVMTLAGAVFLGESVGWRRLVAILVGFVGVLLIVRPGTEGFDIYAMLALGSVVFVTLRDLVTRRLSQEVPGMTVAIAMAAAVAIFGGLASLSEDWQPLSRDMTLRLMATVAFMILGYFTSVQAMRHGDLAVVAPFRYTGLLWALVLGVVMFGYWPDTLTLLGAGIVVATGIFTFYRERQLARSAR